MLHGDAYAELETIAAERGLPLITLDGGQPNPARLADFGWE